MNTIAKLLLRLLAFPHKDIKALKFSPAAQQADLLRLRFWWLHLSRDLWNFNFCTGTANCEWSEWATETRKIKSEGIYNSATEGKNMVAAVAVLLRGEFCKTEGRACTAYLEKRWLDGRNVPAQWEMLDAQLNWQSIAKITPNCKKILGAASPDPRKARNSGCTIALLKFPSLHKNLFQGMMHSVRAAPKSGIRIWLKTMFIHNSNVFK